MYSSSRYVSSNNSADGFLIAALILSVIAAIVLLCTVGAKKRGDKMTGFGKWLNDVINFRKLIIETIFKFLYVACTIFWELAGFYVLFEGVWQGILIILLSPIAIRVVYEFVMLVIILVGNVGEINSKLRYGKKECGKNNFAPPAPERTMYAPAPEAQAQAQGEAQYTFCPNCGTMYDVNLGHCPNCNK